MAYCNLLHCEKKWHAECKTVFAEQQIQNQKDHVTASRAIDGYGGDIEWQFDGQMCSSCCGDVVIDGAGITRSFRNNYHGSTSAAVTISPLTGRPLDLVLVTDKVTVISLRYLNLALLQILFYLWTSKFVSILRPNASGALAL